MTESKQSDAELLDKLDAELCDDDDDDDVMCEPEAWEVDPNERCAAMDELDQEFAAILEAALMDAEAAGLGPMLGETYRTQERQNFLYAQGRTRPGKKVTWTKESKHTRRIAADVYLYPDGTGNRLTWERPYYDRWGAIAEKHGLRWGGTFKGYDGPHVEMRQGE